MEFIKEILLAIGMILLGVLTVVLTKDGTISVLILPMGIVSLIATIRDYNNQKHNRT